MRIYKAKKQEKYLIDPTNMKLSENQMISQGNFFLLKIKAVAELHFLQISLNSLAISAG